MLQKGLHVSAFSALALALSFFSSTSLASYNQHSPMGTNTNEVTDDNSSIPFIDLFKSALPFEDARPWMTKGDVQYDENGWPRDLRGGKVGTRFLSHLPVNTIPDGYYSVLYEGEGKIQYGGDAKFVEGVQGYDLIEITAGDDQTLNASLRILETNPNNHLRNIRILLPGGVCNSDPYKRVDEAAQCKNNDYLSFVDYHQQLIFNPAYLDFMKDFKVIRFMNMAGITRNEIRHWSERNTINKATWGGKEGTRGAPLEVMVELANRVNADPWFSLPHNADDDYVRQFAAYVRDNLSPNQKAYVEYSNETWNTIFSQGNYVRKKGLEQKLDTNAHRAGHRFYSERSVEMFKIWEQVFGGKDRLVRVLSGWTVNTKMTELILTHKNAYQYADAFAIAPYFFGGFKELRGVQSVNDVFQLLTDTQYSYSLPKVLEYILKQRELVEGYGLSLVSYEGGQGVVDFKTKRDDQHPNLILYAANRDQRMYRLYHEFLKGWKDMGGQMFVHYSAPRTYRKFGAWGTKEYITQPVYEAPKYQAILEFIQHNPCWWQSCNPNNYMAAQ